jgi:hypothetical protein
MYDAAALRRWIDHIFNHPVTEPMWFWSEDAPKWSRDRIRIPALIAETFERAGELLARFSDDRLEQGFWYLIGDASHGDFTETLLDETIAAATRLRAVRAFVPCLNRS